MLHIFSIKMIFYIHSYFIDFFFLKKSPHGKKAILMWVYDVPVWNWNEFISESCSGEEAMLLESKFKQIISLSKPEFPTCNIWITPLMKSVVRMKWDKVLRAFPIVLDTCKR